MAVLVTLLNTTLLVLQPAPWEKLYDTISIWSSLARHFPSSIYPPLLVYLSWSTGRSSPACLLGGARFVLIVPPPLPPLASFHPTFTLFASAMLSIYANFLFFTHTQRFLFTELLALYETKLKQHNATRKVGASSGTWENPLMGKSGKTHGIMHVDAEEASTANGMYE